MSSNSRSSWTQHAKNAGINKDFAQGLALKAKQFTDNNDPVQCADCNKLIDISESYKILGSREHLCEICESTYSQEEDT
jgi:hypothetical protein